MSKKGKPQIDPENLPPIPMAWSWTTLGEIAEIVSGVTKGQRHTDTATLIAVPYLRVANVQRGFLDLSEVRTILATPEKIDKLRLRVGDVLFNEGGDRDKLGRGWVWNGELEHCIHQNHVFRARLRNGINPKFVSFHANSFGQEWFWRHGTQSVNLASINQTALRQFPVPLPPTDEQDRIVSKIEELFSDLDAGMSALERAKANLKRYRASVLKAAVEGRLTADWRAANPDIEPATEFLHRILTTRRQTWEANQLAEYERKGKKPPAGWKDQYSEPDFPDTNTLPKLPKGWCWATAEQMGEIQLGRQRAPKNRSKDYPTKYIRAANITESGIDTTDILDMEFTPAEFERYRMKNGDIVVSEASGSPDQVGKPAVWNDEIPECCFQNTVIRLRPDGISSDYLLVVFTHCYVNKVFAKLAGGVGINHLSAAKFSKISIPLAPAFEQSLIVQSIEQKLSVIAKTEMQIETNRRRAVRLRQSILQSAFTGRLTPDQTELVGDTRNTCLE